MTTRSEAEKAAVKHTLAEREYESVFYSWLNTLEKLSPNRFWQLLEHYRRLVFTATRYDTELAADEFFRLALVKAADPVQYSLDEACRFAITYEITVSRLTRYFDRSNKGIEFGRTDDSYHDLMDSLPLAGRNFYRTAKAGGFHTLKQVEACIKTNVVPSLVKRILNGENYNVTFLREKAAEFFTSSDAVVKKIRQIDDDRKSSDDQNWHEAMQRASGETL
jgi:hypothetical protein